MERSEFHVNYIKHLTGVLDKFAQDKRLTPSHISLYLALFQFWNLNRFQNPISITRSEVMEISKIGSANTYTRCLKELHLFGYIKYSPSFSPIKGSLVDLYNFDKGSDKGSDTTSDTGSEMVLRPSINNKKQNKQVNIETDTPPDQKEKKLKMIRPDLQSVREYFKEKNVPEIEAEKFFNYYESNGWLVGGTTPMKNWQAAVRNWIINARKFASPEPEKNKLSTTTEKDYGRPL